MSVSLLERDQALDTLTGLLGEAANGTGRCALISGEAGIGKSALVENFCEQQQKMALCYWGRCEALFTPRPLGPLYDIAQQLNTTLLRDALHQEMGRSVIFSAVLDALSAHTGPAVVIIEDIHWADEATLDLLKFLGRRVSHLPILLILTYRDDEIGGDHPLWFVLGDLPSRTTKRLHLAPLSQSAVATLARQAPSLRMDVAALYAVTGGNPFFVTEALASQEEGTPETIRAAVLARIARLSPQGYAALELASVVPARTEWWLLEAILPHAAASVEECVHTGVLRLEAEAVAFRHELARLVVQNTLPPLRQKMLHAAALHALQAKANEGDVSPFIARLVHHAALADDHEAVLLYAPLAAQQSARQGAHREAAIHYQTALQFADLLSPAQQAELSEGRAYECYLTNQFEAAIQAQRGALVLWRAQENGERIGRNLRWLSRLNWFLGDKAEAERYALEASGVLEALPPGKELAMAYSNIAQLRMLEDNAPAAVQWGTQAMELAARLGDDEILAHALTNVGTARYATGDEEGRRRLEASVQIALAHNFEEHVARAYTNLASVSVMFRLYARALEYLDAGIRYTTERDLDSWRLYMTGWRARANFEQGDWASASQEAEQVLASYRVSPVVRISALITLGWVRLRRGDPGGEPLLREARELALKTGEPQRIVPVAAARAEMAWLQGDLAACKSEAHAAYTLAVHHANPWDVGQMSYWLWKTGEEFDIPAGLPDPYAQQLVGDWQAAAATWQRIGCPYEEALALATGDAPARQRALNLLGRLGARATIERLRQEQCAGRSPRMDRIPRGPRPSTQKNPAGLTNQQFEVLRMMVGGLNNSEIAAALQVSPKTVEHHVSAVLAKLVVRSRAQAVAQAHNLGVTPNLGERTPPR